MTNIEYKVCVVTVTYGDRWKFLKQVLQRVIGFNHVSTVVIVNNASQYSVDAAVKEFTDDRLIVINESENLGSAGGYKKGLAYATSLNCDFVFLIDDDNLPDENCLQLLIDYWEKIESDNLNKALFCLREDRLQHLKIARGEDPYRFYLAPDNFLGFSLFRIFYNQYKKLKDRFCKNQQLKRYVKIPYVPYGGLFFYRSMLQTIGYPAEEFYLYVDDTEYTYRITEKEHNIWLIPECKITDIDKSQGINYTGGVFRSKLLDQWSFRTYYHIRNMIYFNKKAAVKNKLMFNINKLLYLSGLWFISKLSSKEVEYKHVLNAVNDGLAGRLGRKY